MYCDFSRDFIFGRNLADMKNASKLKTQFRDSEISFTRARGCLKTAFQLSRPAKLI